MQEKPLNQFSWVSKRQFAQFSSICRVNIGHAPPQTQCFWSVEGSFGGLKGQMANLGSKTWKHRTRKKLGSVFGRTDFPRIFVFGPPDFSADFAAGFCLLIFVGKKCPEKSSRKIPRQNPPKFTQQESPTYFCRGAGPKRKHRNTKSCSICLGLKLLGNIPDRNLGSPS